MPITPTHWGSPKWISIHVTCYFIDTVYGTNIKKQQQLHQWLEDSAYMLPCGICTHHFLKFMTENPLPTAKIYEAGETPYLRWSIKAHNAVRTRQHKPLADEELVVLTYKSGQIYGINTLTPTSLQTIAPTCDSSKLEGERTSYNIAAYIFGSLVLLGLLVFFIYLGMQTMKPSQINRKKVLEMSE